MTAHTDRPHGLSSHARHRLGRHRGIAHPTPLTGPHGQLHVERTDLTLGCGGMAGPPGQKPGVCGWSVGWSLQRGLGLAGQVPDLGVQRRYGVKDIGELVSEKALSGLFDVCGFVYSCGDGLYGGFGGLAHEPGGN